VNGQAGYYRENFSLTYFYNGGMVIPIPDIIMYVLLLSSTNLDWLKEDADGDEQDLDSKPKVLRIFHALAVSSPLKVQPSQKDRATVGMCKE
jgi:hypothetical protein